MSPTPEPQQPAAQTAASNHARPDTQPVAELRAVTKRYGQVTALAGVSLSVYPGEVLALLGPNGAGKTTAVSVMLGLARPTGGTATLFAEEPRSAASRMRVGAMLQLSGVPETLTVSEHLRLFATYYPAPLEIEYVLKLAGLEEVRNRAYGKLSGGQKQRLHFALAMVGNPDLLFLDEPTTGLDVNARRAFWLGVRDYLRGGKAVVLTTHYLEEADALADRVVVLSRGTVIAEGTPESIKSRAGGKRVSALSTLSTAEAAALPGVVRSERVGPTLQLFTTAAEATVRELLRMDEGVAGLEVVGAGLEEAFISLTERSGAEVAA